ncbi:uncharacterized protein LOC143352403 [Halictus rubicundus]|uniref:uncharacterized protein LOC143352403 n=1 Tax=Halictus rubicundus TaxID=77578 RepID=UPI004036E476
MSQNITIHLIMCGIGIIIGISACIFFFVIHGNPEVGFWSILSGIIAAVCFHLHWVKGNGTLGRWHSKTTLNYLNFIGFLTALSAFAALIWYLFLTFYYHIPIEPLSTSTVIASVYAMICSKWGILLTYHSHKYELIIQEEHAPILTESIA